MIKIKNWSKYQSYKDRRPPWIRFHRTMLDDYAYQKMSADSRALLPMLWLLACEDEDPRSGLIQLEIEEISFRLRQPEKIINKCINELQSVDFIECIESVTKPLRECNEIVSTEAETEAEKRQNNKVVLDYSSLNMSDKEAIEFIRIRKSNGGGKITQRVINGLGNEFDKARRDHKMTNDDILTEWETRGWKSFKSEWVKGIFSNQQPEFDNENTDWAVDALNGNSGIMGFDKL